MQFGRGPATVIGEPPRQQATERRRSGRRRGGSRERDSRTPISQETCLGEHLQLLFVERVVRKCSRRRPAARTLLHPITAEGARRSNDPGTRIPARATPALHHPDSLHLRLPLAGSARSGRYRRTSPGPGTTPTSSKPTRATSTRPRTTRRGLPVIVVEEVNITAARSERSVHEVPGNVTVIDRETIDRSGARNVPELLRREAGIFVTNTTTNREGYTAEARGFNNGGGNGGRTLVLIDGRRVNEPDGGLPDWAFMPLDNVERIEVVRGPVNALYGDNAIAGVDPAAHAPAGAGPPGHASRRQRHLRHRPGKPLGGGRRASRSPPPSSSTVTGPTATGTAPISAPTASRASCSSTWPAAASSALPAATTARAATAPARSPRKRWRRTAARPHPGSEEDFDDPRSTGCSSSSSWT